MGKLSKIVKEAAHEAVEEAVDEVLGKDRENIVTSAGDMDTIEEKIKLMGRTVRIRLTDDILGTVSKNQAVYKDHVQNKARQLVKEGKLDDVTEDDLDEEIENIEEVEEKGWTGFLSDPAGIYLGNHMIKGQIKAALESCMAIGAVAKIPSYKKWVDNLLFVRPKKLRFINEKSNSIINKPDAVFERPLRGMTAKGPRVTVTRSDIVKAGREIEFNLIIMPNSKNLDWKSVLQALDYGRFVGLGSWRGSGGKGTFEIVSYSEEFSVKKFM